MNRDRHDDVVVNQYARYERDSDDLVTIGRWISADLQDDASLVRLPLRLAETAVAAWGRDELEALAEPESPWQQAVRDRAAVLALIGCAISERGVVDRDLVTFDIDAGLLDDVKAAGRGALPPQ